MACKYHLNVTFIKECGAVWIWDSPSSCLLLFAIYIEESTCYCLEAWGVGMRRDGDPPSGVMSSETTDIFKCVCVFVCANVDGIKSIMQPVFPYPQGRVTWLLIVAWNVSCPFVSMWPSYWHPEWFSSILSQPLFVDVKVFICSQYSVVFQHQPLRKLIDHSYCSCCAADVHSICPNYSCYYSVLMMDCIQYVHIYIF